MVDDEEIYQTLSEVFEEVFGREDIVLTPETTAVNVPGWNSLKQVNIIVATELHFGIRFSAGEVDGLKKVGDLVALIKTKRHC